MFNLGLAEIAVIVLVGLLIFGPDKLPKAVKTLSDGMRSFRTAANSATKQLQDAAGWDSAETRQTFNDLADLHPKRLMGSLLDDSAERGAVGDTPAQAGRPVAKPPAVADYDPDAP